MTQDTGIGHITLVGPMIASVELGGGAVMSVLNPRSFQGGGLQWRLRYGDPSSVRLVAASVVEDYDALTSGEYTMAETMRRLRILRRARAALTGEDKP